MEYRYNINANGTHFLRDITTTNKKQAIKWARESAKAYNPAGNIAYWTVYIPDNKYNDGYKIIARGYIDGKGRNHYQDPRL